MTQFIAIHDKVIGILIEDFGIKQTKGGLLIHDKDGSVDSIKPRWFQITHVGPDNLDVEVGDHVLVSHGRWSRGFELDKTANTKYYQLDVNEMLLKSDTFPL